MIVVKITWYKLRNRDKQLLHALLCTKGFIVITCVDCYDMPSTWSYLFIYVKEEVWSVFSWFPSSISRLLSVHCWVETYTLLRNKALLKLMAYSYTTFTFLFNVIYRTLGHSHLFSEDFDISPAVIFPTNVLPHPKWF